MNFSRVERFLLWLFGQLTCGCHMDSPDSYVVRTGCMKHDC